MLEPEAVRINNFVFVRKLEPTLFSENYSYKNSEEKFIQMSENNEIYEKKLNVDQELTMKYMEDADISHRNYSTTIVKRRETERNISKFRVYMNESYINLFELINKTEQKRLAEEIARYYLMQILDVLECLHNKCVYYLTLRPEDICLDFDFNLKLKNFCIPNAVIKSSLDWIKYISIGNTHISPEVSTRTEAPNEKSDIFNLGVLLFTMVTGGRPFFQLNQFDPFFKYIFHKDKNNYWRFVDKATKTKLSVNFKDLVFRMMNYNCKDRIGLDEIRLHPWINSEKNLCQLDIINFFKFVINQHRNRNINIPKNQRDNSLFMQSKAFKILMRLIWLPIFKILKNEENVD